MIYLLPPNRPLYCLEHNNRNIPASTQLSEIWKTLGDYQRIINLNLGELTPAGITKGIANAVNAASGKSIYTPNNKNNFEATALAIKSNIIKTADIVVRDSKTFASTLAGNRTFISEFGRLFGSATLNIEGTPVGIRQLYTWHETLESDFGSYVANSQQYIKDGLLGFDGISPIYGIEVGIISETIKIIDEDGQEQTIHIASPIKTRITPAEWSLWRNDVKICYTNENDIYFPSAHITGGSISIGDHFTVNNQGQMTASSVDLTGKITSSQGSIGGWSIGGAGISKSFTKNGTNYYVGLNSDPSDSTSSAILITAGENTMLRAEYGGYLFAKNADIEGVIKSTQGNIAGWNINQNALQKEITIGSDTYTVTLRAGGNIASDTAAILVQKNGQHQFYVTYGGTTYAKNATIEGTLKAGSIIETSSGTEGGSDALVSKIGTVEVWPYNTGSTYGGTKFTNKSSLDSESYIALCHNLSYMGAMQNNSSGSPLTYASVTTRSDGIGRLSGTWSYDVGSSGDLSDKKKKNSITDMSDKYSILFDNLRPRCFKYNEGTSGRIHTGFIAQEVEEAVEKAGLTSQDAALVMDIADMDNDGNYTGESTKSLRYTEIIALLTKELQSVKKQLAELKQAVEINNK